MENRIFSSYPYEKPKSKELMMHVKKGSIDPTRELLSDNRFLVYDFDQVFSLLLLTLKCL